MPDQVDWRALEREASPGRAVGRLLRDQREARGLDLDEVAKSLRIRRTQLEAIEDGRFERLPGAAYVPAFLRAYAAHVGLDPEKVLTAYHLSGPVPIKRPVTLPADFPIVEKRAPIGLAVLTVLMVVAAGYAAWHYLPREQAVVAEKVPPVPDRLLATRPADPQPAPATAPAAPQAVPSQAASPAPMAPDTWPPRPVVTAAPPPAPAAPAQAPIQTQASGPTQATAPQATAPQATAPQPAPLAPPVVSAAPPPPPPPMPTFGQAQAAQPQPVAPATPPQQAEAPRPAAPVPAVEEASRPPVAETASSLPVRADTRVTVRVNSWIELRAPNGDVLAQSFVRAGESYVVPAGIAYRITDAR